MASTVKVDKIEGSTGSTVEVTSGQTFKATAPIVATSILDTNSNELVKLTATGSATNELTVANAATGSGPTLSSTGSSDSNIDINITPAGTGDVVLKTDLVSLGGGSETGHLSSNGAYDLKLDTNSSTNSGSIVITDGANGDIDVTPNGTGDVNLGADTVQVGDNDANATITTQGTGDLILNTNNGTDAGKITLLDGANGNIEFTNNGTGVVKFNDAAYCPEATLTFDATQDWDVQASPVAKVTLTANVTFDAPSNPTTGQFISILCIQDAGGSNTIAWDAVFEFASDTAPTATTTGDKGDLFSFRYNGAKWLSVGTTLALTLS